MIVDSQDVLIYNFLLSYIRYKVQSFCTYYQNFITHATNKNSLVGKLYWLFIFCLSRSSFSFYIAIHIFFKTHFDIISFLVVTFFRFVSCEISTQIRFKLIIKTNSIVLHALQINRNRMKIEDASLDTCLSKLQIYFSPINYLLTKMLINKSSFCYNRYD